MSVIQVLLLGFSAFLVAATPAVPNPQLTARDILSRSAKASGISIRTSQFSVEQATLTERGLTETITAISKQPDKVLVRSEYPWLHLVEFRGFDGRNAWTSTNLGGSGAASPSVDKLVRSEASYYNDADVLPNRWLVSVVRLSDIKIAGRQYYQILETPKGGNARTLYVDRKTFVVRGASFAKDRYDWCVKSVMFRGRLMCTEQEIHDRGQLVGSVAVRWIDIGVVDDVQFSAPHALPDSTTKWLLDGYAASSHEPSVPVESSLQGNVVFGRYTGSEVFLHMDWRLDIRPPDRFLNTISMSKAAVYSSNFDGTRGSITTDGQTADAGFSNALLAMIYGRCELHAALCGVVVTRLANVTFVGRQYFAIEVTSKRDPRVWYSELLDIGTYLPHVAWTPDTMLCLTDYVPSSSSALLPASWSYQRLWSKLTVTGVRRSSSPASNTGNTGALK